MIKTIIIDDEKKACFYLKKLLEKNFSNIKVCGISHNIADAEKQIINHNPDLIFLDIEMPNGSGFKLLEKLDSNAISFQIVFTTAYDKYAIKAIKYSALDYLLKPIDTDELQAAVERAVNKKNIVVNQKQIEILLRNYSLSNKHFSKIAIPNNNGYKFLSPNDIYLIEADGSYSVISLTNEEKIIASKNLKYFENLLDNNIFIRIHRNYIINLNHVSEYIKGDILQIIFFNNKVVEVAYRRKKEVQEKMLKANNKKK